MRVRKTDPREIRITDRPDPREITQADRPETVITRIEQVEKDLLTQTETITVTGITEATDPRASVRTEDPTVGTDRVPLAIRVASVIIMPAPVIRALAVTDVTTETAVREIISRNPVRAKAL